MIKSFESKVDFSQKNFLKSCQILYLLENIFEKIQLTHANNLKFIEHTVKMFYSNTHNSCYFIVLSLRSFERFSTRNVIGSFKFSEWFLYHKHCAVKWVVYSAPTELRLLNLLDQVYCGKFEIFCDVLFLFTFFFFFF